MLDDIVARDKCKLAQQYTHVNAGTRISFICGEPECSNEYNKVLSCMFLSGGYCKQCTCKRRLEKCKATSIQKYGCDNPLQSEAVKEKIKKTNIQKYGVENPFQSETIKDKIKKTNLEKYGVEHGTQCKSVKDKYKQTMLEKYGVENGFQAEECKRKIKETMMQKYGCENPQQCPVIKQKTKETVKDRYGCDNPMQNADVQNKGRNTNLIKYGCENPFQADECKEKSKQTCLDKYGVEYAAQCNDIKKKAQETCIKRYGAPHPSQCPDIIDKQFKNTCKLKDYTFPCGTVVQVQGYEPWALDELVNLGYTKLDIVTEKKDVPELWYEKEGTRRRYFCDIYIPKENKMIEVKSTYTYQHHSGNVQEKAQASVDAGFDYEIWVYDEDGNKEVVVYKNGS